MKKYNTEQRKLLLAFFEENPDKQFSIEDIRTELCKSENISTSSVYRNIKEMLGAELIARFPAPGKRQFLYQYVGSEKCRTHIHMKCESCGQLIHLDDSVMHQIVSAIEGAKDFTLDIQKTIFYGTCARCA